eukprot:GHRQ01038358.1.p1 GENE.GHRQ01038358.1~~GHRQ01038358.1.p1  ORF type:complete len:104 (-),score=29.90 GHRQ01038358.1:184-495(-)
MQLLVRQVACLLAHRAASQRRATAPAAGAVRCCCALLTALLCRRPLCNTPCSHGSADYLSLSYDMKRPVYIQSTWLKSRDSMGSFPMRYGFVTDLLEEVSLCK